jgi:ABC-2 type transport system ATP-binding protein
MTTTLAEFAAVTKDFKGHRATDALSLAFKSGSTVGLLGPNGAGKTSCLKMMLGLLRPTSGSVSIFGQDVLANGPQVRQHIGYVPEDPWLYPWMTVRQVMRFASAMYDRWSAALAEDLLAQFDLPPDRAVKKLSKGMRVKAALLVALAHRPRLLVLDEPMSGLDPLARDELIEILVKSRSEETECIILSTHQIDDVARLADEVAILNAGKLLVHSPIDDLIGTTKRVEAVLLDGRLPQCALRQTVWQRIDRRNWSMTLHPFDATMLHALREANPVAEATVIDIGLEEIFKDFIRGAVRPCCVP